MRAMCCWMLVAMVGALLLAASPVAEAGAVTGPAVATHLVSARATDTFCVRFEAGEPAIVVVEGDGDTDLDLYVYDENGRLIASDEDDTDDCVARWTPRWTGRFTIKVVNLGRVSNVYRIGHN